MLMISSGTWPCYFGLDSKLLKTKSYVTYDKMVKIRETHDRLAIRIYTTIPNGEQVWRSLPIIKILSLDYQTYGETGWLTAQW